MSALSTADAAGADPEGLARAQHRLHRGLRRAVLLVTVAVLVPAGPVRHWGERGDRWWVQVLCWGVLVAVPVGDAWLAGRGRGWGAARWPTLGAVLAAAALSRLALPADALASPSDWVWGAFGWVALLLLLDLGNLTPMVLLLTAHLLVTVLRAALTAPPQTLLVVVSGATGTIGFPLAATLVAITLRRIGRRSHAAAWEVERLRATEEAERRVHEQRADRYTELYHRAAPLLQGLADASLDPADPAVQRACRVEASRMRRLFAETDPVGDRLLHELRQGADVAERLGVEVTLTTVGLGSIELGPMELGATRAPEPPLAVRRALVEPVLAALAVARTRARVTVAATEDLLSVSVLVDATLVMPVPATSPEVQVLLDEEGDETWVEARWQLGGSPR